MSLTNARIKAMIDAELTNHTHIGHSTNGVSETSIMQRMAVSALGGWTQPTESDSYQPTNASAGASAVATGAGTITHWATFDAASGGSQLTVWMPVTDPDPPLVTGGMLSYAAGALKPTVAGRA